MERVEAGAPDDAETMGLLRKYVAPIQDAGADQLVLGCTHYYFLRASIERLLGPAVTVLEPAKAIARQLGERSHLVPGLREGDAHGGFSFFSSATDLMAATTVMTRLWSTPIQPSVQRCPV